MAVSAFTVANIKPALGIDANQRFIFGLEEAPEPLGSFKLDNNFTPIIGTPSQLNFETRNKAFSGYRWIHTTQSTETYGSYKLQRFLTASPTGIDLIIFNDNGSFSIPGISDAKFIIQTAVTNLPNAQSLGALTTGLLKNTVTTGTGVLSTAITGTDYYSPADPGTLNFPRVGIGINPTVNGRIQFAAIEMVNKISLFNSTGNDYNQSGLGYNSLGTLYHAPSFTSHTFYLGDSTTIPLRAHLLGITISELKAINSDFRRIMLYDNGENIHQCYNIGIKDIDGTNRAIHSQIGHFDGAFTWAAALTSSSSYELMSLTGLDLALRTGNISITESTNFHKWNLNSKSDGTFSLFKSSIPANEFLLSSSSTSSIASIVNTNSSAVSNYRCGTSTDYIELGYDGPNDYSFINIEGPSNDRLAFRVGGTGIAALLQSGLFGIGTITPTQAKLVVVGGVTNVGSEESCIRAISASTSAKIEIQNTTPSTGKIFELRSGSTGNFDITDRTASTTRFAITSAGNIGINMGTSAINAPLQLNNTVASRKIVIFESANNDHQFKGLGHNTDTFRFQTNQTGDSFVFFAATSSSASNEVARISGTGTFTVAKIQGRTANVPGVVAGTAAGSSPSLTIAGAELSGTLTVIAGSTPSGTIIATFTLTAAMANSSYGVVITPANQTTAALATDQWINVTSTTQFTLNCATALVNGTTYKWNYQVVGC